MQIHGILHMQIKTLNHCQVNAEGTPVSGIITVKRKENNYYKYFYKIHCIGEVL